jgi:hypothetical protein
VADSLGEALAVSEEVEEDESVEESLDEPHAAIPIDMVRARAARPPRRRVVLVMV